MQPGVYATPLYIRQGDDFEWHVRIQQPRLIGEPPPEDDEDLYEDLTGVTPSMQLRTNKAQTGSPLAAFVCQVTDQDTDRGGIMITLLPPATRALIPTAEAAAVLDDDGVWTVVTPADLRVWDLQLVWTTDVKVRTYLEGWAIVAAEVTK